MREIFSIIELKLQYFPLAINYDDAIKPKIYNLIINITDGSGNTIDIPVSINVIPENEHSPVAPNLTVSLSENSEVGQLVYAYSGSDSDYSPHNIVLYEITEITPNIYNEIFVIDQLNGKIHLSKTVDYEAPDKTIELIIKVTDGGGLESSGTVTVSILDFNDNSPSCKNNIYYGSIPEGSPENTFILTISDCSDLDTAGNMGVMEFSISSGDDNGQFKIVKHTNITLQTTASTLDFETRDNYNLDVLIIDNLGGSPRLTTKIKLIITVSGINDNTPTWENFIPIYNSSFKYSLSEGAAIGTSVFTARATDNDRTGTNDSKLVFSITSVGITFNGLHLITNKKLKIKKIIFRQFDIHQCIINLLYYKPREWFGKISKSP